MTWNRSLAFNNDDGKTLYKKTKQIYLQKKNKKIKTSLLMMIQIGILPIFGGPCPRNVLWNGNQKIRAIFQLLTRRAFGNVLADFNTHWLHSEI